MIDIDVNPALMNLLNYKANNAKIRAFHKSNAKVRLLLGGKRSGKSTAAMVEALWAGLGIHPYITYPPPPLQIRYCTVDTLSGIKGIVIPMMKSWVGSFDNGPVVKRYWAEERIIEFKNGTTIDLKSYDQDVIKFEGVPRHLVVEDEIPPLDIHQSNLLRTVSGGINGRVVIAGTPMNGLDWVYDMYYDNADAVPPAVEWWQIKTIENPHNTEEEIESIKRDPSM